MNGNGTVSEEILWRHLRDLPYFRAMVRAQGGDPRAIAGLVDAVIVGRQIYGAEDPAREAAAFEFLRR